MAVHPSRRSVLGLLGAAPVAVFAAAGIGVPAAADDQSRAVPAGLRPGGELDQLVANLAAQDRFSGSLLLTQRGRTVLARSHGMADQQRGIPNGPGTVFSIASLTKLFTAVAIAQLVQQRKLGYGSRLGTFLDGFPGAVADSVTVHHLLTHTSGFGDHHHLPGYEAAAAGWTTPEQAMAGTTDFIRKSEPGFAAGTRWFYSNAGYHLLGAIVEKVSGQSYYDYVRQHVFATAGMTATRFLTRPEWQAGRNFARPYYRDAQGRWTDGTAQFGFVVGGPAGGAFTTCADLERFGRLLAQERLADHGQTALLLSGKVPLSEQGPFQCYGPVGTLAGGQWTFGLGGGNTAGVSTTVNVFPESGWTMAVLSNYADADLQAIESLSRRLITGG